MSKPRQRLRIAALAYDYPAGYQVPAHRHAEHQLVFAQSGVMTLTTADGTWVVPPDRAVWVPRQQVHSISMSGRVEMRTLYLSTRALLPGCQVVDVSPLLRELMVRIVARGGLAMRGPIERAMYALLEDELRVLPARGVHLPLPRDPRARRVVERLRAAPGAHHDVPALVRAAGLSLRTLQRVLLAETGLSFGRYVRQLRLLRALELLARGDQVTSVALDSGYATPSAFITAFSRAFGLTPARYFPRKAS